MKTAISIVFALIVVLTIQSHDRGSKENHDYQWISDAQAKPENSEKEKEKEQTQNNKKRLKDIENQQRDIHKNLKELKLLVQDKCRKK